MTTGDRYYKLALEVAEMAYEHECGKDPHCHPSHNAVKALEMAAKILDLGGFTTFGVEGTSVPSDSLGDKSARSLSYLNAGDTYAKTILWDETSEEFSIGCWGDWYQNAEEAYQEDTDTVKCAYCGAFNEVEDRDANEKPCDCCGHFMNGDEAVTKYVIEDWAGKKPFGDMLFDTFESAWEHIDANVPEGDREEFEVETVRVRKG